LTFTYVGTGLTDLDILRRMIGDKDSDDPLMTDEELSAILGENDHNINRSAAVACEEIASAFARQAVQAVGDLTQNLAQKSDNYRKQARLFWQRDDGGPEEESPGPAFSKSALVKTDWRRPLGRK